MELLTPTNILIWAIAALAVAGMLTRPWAFPEALWAAGGAALLLVTRLVSPADAWGAVRHGGDVYGFLTGMMLLAEVARAHGLFDWLAALATRQARGDARRLFTLIYGVGVVVTMLLSNDATAVVLTPAVYAAARSAGVTPLPYLYICAFIANAASFTLPIANPANLVVFGNHLPSLLPWLERFSLPSVAAIALTYVVLRWTQRRPLREPVSQTTPLPPLPAAGRWAAAGILATGALLLVLSAAGLPLGAASAAAGAATLLATQVRARCAPWALLRAISWSVLPLVAGLFVLVAALDRTGVIRSVGVLLSELTARSPVQGIWFAGPAVALASNVANNLPIALVASKSLALLSANTGAMASTLLISVDLGPNLSVTGSLATVLWLIALRREGERIDAWQFLRVGALVMIPALLACLTIVCLQGLS